MRFKRPCERCGKLFQPTGRFGKYCDDCIIPQKNKKTHIVKSLDLRRLKAKKDSD